MKSINREIIKELRNYSEMNYAVNHLRIPTSEHGRAEVACLVEKIIRFSNLLPRKLNDMERATLMYHIVTRLISYDHDELNAERYSYLQAIRNGKAVCMGIAELYYILCTACGVKCQIIVGYSTDSQRDDAYHAWNQVRLNNGSESYSWYMADPTWDLSENNHSWKYFMKSDSYFLMNGHYWLKRDYEHCEFNLDNNTGYSEATVDRILSIFKQIVC